MDAEIKQWIDDAKYLPEIIRDFHDQKDLFKAIHETVNVEGHSYCGDVDWVKGHNYVVDVFLWYMAQRGYTLQRNRTDLPFRDLGADMQAGNAIRRDRLKPSLKELLAGSHP